jgi:hypothetical protein
MIHDLTDAVLDCAVPAIVTRNRTTGLSKGRKTTPLVTRFEILASISPLTAADLERLSEGQKSGGEILIITPCELFTSSSSECRIADELSYQGNDYQISVVKDWHDLGGFYECMGTRVQR